MRESALYEELLESIEEVLAITPCGDFETFSEVMQSQLGTELVDVYGHDGTAIGEGLRELWQNYSNNGRN